MTSNRRPQRLPILLRAQQSYARLDRTTRLSQLALAFATLFLVILVALITFFPVQAVSQALSAQAREQQMVLAESLARQSEDYFNGIAYELLDLANRPEIKASATTARNAALNELAALGQGHQGQIKAIVRLSSDGVPLYAWPDSYDKRVQAGQTLPWSVDRAWVQSVVQNRSVRLMQQPLAAGGTTYLLVAPINQATTTSEALAVELDLPGYFKTSFDALGLSTSSQLWVFDYTGTEIYRYRDQPVFSGSFNQLPITEKTTVLANYPADGRESILTPIFAVPMPGSHGNPPLKILLSQATSEGQEAVYSTLRVLFLLGLIVVGFIVLFSLIVARVLWRENYRRRDDARRRSSIRTLLTTSRALNSSLDLNRTLALILDELGRILPHENASILLLNEDNTTVSVAAEKGQVMIEEGRHAIPIDNLPRVKEVISGDKPIVHNGLVDPRWTSTEGADRTYAWLGVPLRFRTEAIGILTVESNNPNRFRPEDIDLAEAFADQASVALQNARAHEYEVHTYATELETARAIQSSLLPHEDPPVPQMQIAARTIAARQVSGDYYQYYLLPDGKIGVAVGDVSGKGTPAALLMAVITTSMREEIQRVPSAAALLNELNTRLGERMKQTNMNSALLMTIFDPATRHLEIANAGMVQPYVYDGAGWREVPVGGYPVGASARSNYTAKTVTLAPGSLLVIVTDGIIESQNLQKEFFGFERLEAVLAEIRDRTRRMI